VSRVRVRFRFAVVGLCFSTSIPVPAAISKELTRTDFVKITYQTLLKYESEFKLSGYIVGSCEDGLIANTKGVSLLGHRASNVRFEMYLESLRNEFKNEKDATESYFRYLADIQTAAFVKAFTAECPNVW
jgi:hypothetical protein